MGPVATIPTYRTWVAGEIVTAAEMNSNVRDAGNFWLGVPTCNIYNNTGVSCVSGTATLIPFDSESEDNDGMHSTTTNPSRVIANTPGLYDIRVALRWLGATATSTRSLNMRLNAAGSSAGGTSITTKTEAANSTATAGASNAHFQERSFHYRFVNVGDYLELFGTQTTGGALSTDSGLRVVGLQATFMIA